MVAVAVLATAAIVHGSGPPFTYRLGQRPDRELRVNVKEFQIRNQTKTSNERQAAADQVPPSLVNDPAPIRELAERLDDLTVAIAKSARLEDLPENVRATWKLDARDASSSSRRPPTPPSAATTCTRRSPRRSRRLSATACSGPTPCRPTRNRAARCRSATAGEPRSTARLVPRERVVPERIVKPDGPVYQEFCAAFTSPRIGQILFGLIADQLDGTPTLTYEAEATAKLREEARDQRRRPLRHLHAAATCWSSRARRSARSSSSCSGSSTTRPSPSLGFGDRVRRAVGILVLVAALFVLTGYYV